LNLNLPIQLIRGNARPDPSAQPWPLKGQRELNYKFNATSGAMLESFMHNISCY
jgi:hypothetical protein